MSVRLYLKDNFTGDIHEYGENCHDSLVLQPDGSLHYENMQNLAGTEDTEYTFVLKDGTDPREAEDYIKYGVEAYVDIGGIRDISDLPKGGLITKRIRWNYERALQRGDIRDKIAWALYQTWKDFDNEGKAHD